MVSHPQPLTNCPPLLALERVSRVYSKSDCAALSDLTLQINHREYLAIMGPSGSGKSTLLHLISGLDFPTSGKVLFEGREYLNARDWASLRARRIGFVFQAFNLLPALTAEQNIEVAMIGLVRSSRKRRNRADELLYRVGLEWRRKHLPGEMSGGEKQRLSIARSLANSPDLLLADEPTGNLDSQTSKGILELLEDIHAKLGTTLVIVTHDKEIARRVERVVMIRDGRITSDRQEGSKDSWF
jgi:putative ABC transport system ATP-binding protein